MIGADLPSPRAFSPTSPKLILRLTKLDLRVVADETRSTFFRAQPMVDPVVVTLVEIRKSKHSKPVITLVRISSHV